MNAGRTIFSQVMDCVPWYQFCACVDRYRGNHRARSFTCWDHFLCMAFAQLTYRESLRDIEVCLRASHDKLYHMGIRGAVSRSTLADANETRDWRIYADFAQVLIHEARRLYADDDFGLELDQTVYALDATIIDLCLSVFPWARFRAHKGGIKLHTLLDLRGNIPVFIQITPAQVHEVNILDDLVPEPGSIYVMDRGYIDFLRLHALAQSLSIFVIRAKENLQFKRLYSHPVDKTSGLICDQTIRLTGPKSAREYPDRMRRVRIHDPETGKKLIFLSNDFLLPALTIAQLYRRRWHVELFFKWIKQHLRIKAFYGTSSNAVKTQIWIAIAVYVLVAILSKRHRVERDFYTILQILSIMVFEKAPVAEALSKVDYKSEHAQIRNQLQLFDF